jgi:hypothetical protein
LPTGSRTPGTRLYLRRRDSTERCAAIRYFFKWYGTLVTTMFGRNSSAPLMSSDV